jgi:hypothetical protein
MNKLQHHFLNGVFLLSSTISTSALIATVDFQENSDHITYIEYKPFSALSTDVALITSAIFCCNEVIKSRNKRFNERNRL